MLKQKFQHLGAAHDRLGVGDKAIRHSKIAENLFTKKNNSFMMAQAEKNLDHFKKKYGSLVNGGSK